MYCRVVVPAAAGGSSARITYGVYGNVLLVDSSTRQDASWLDPSAQRRFRLSVVTCDTLSQRTPVQSTKQVVSFSKRLLHSRSPHTCSF